MKKKGDKVRVFTKFTEEQMRRAVLKVVEDGSTVAIVAEEMNVCKKTLKSYVDKYLSTSADKKSEFVFRPNYEINQVFTHELEKIFEENLLNVNRTSQKISRPYIRKAAFEFALACNVHVPKTWNIRRRTGLDWMYGYLNRHPIVKQTVIFNKKMKVAHNKDNKCKSGAAATRENENSVASDGMEEEIIAFEYVDVASMEAPKSSDVYLRTSSAATTAIVWESETSCDDAAQEWKFRVSPVQQQQPPSLRFLYDAEDSSSGVDYCTNYAKLPDPCAHGADDGNVMTTVCVKTVTDEFEENLRDAYRAISTPDSRVPSERVFNMDEITLGVENPPSPQRCQTFVTAYCFIGADGSALPPFLKFPRRRFKRRLLDGYAAGSCGVASVDGVLGNNGDGGGGDDDVFLRALAHFADATYASRVNRAVLVVDDDDSHVTVGAIDLCERRGVELVTLPPSCARQLQPIRRRVYKTLSAYFTRACNVYRIRNPDQFVSLYDVSALFNAVYPLAFTRQNIVAGFEETGLYPLNEKVFAEVDALTLKLENDDSLVEPLEHEIELIPTGIESSEESEDEEEFGVGSASEQQDCTADVDRPKMLADESTTEQPSSILMTPYDLNLADDFEKSPLREYFGDLVFAFDELNRHGGISPDRVLNVDEIELVVRMCENESCADGVRLVSGCCVSAAGKSFPPFLVCAGDVPEVCSTSCGGGVVIEGALYCSERQFADEDDLFVAMLEHFVKQVPATPAKRVMLLMDDERGHVTVKSLDFCHANGVVLVSVPPHVPVPLQPLEKTLFKTLTTNFAAECDRFLHGSGAGKITTADMIALFSKVYADTFLADAILDSFNLAGIWPLSEKKIQDGCAKPK